MGGQPFDDVTRRAAAGVTRRRSLLTLGSAWVALTALASPAVNVARKKKGKKKKEKSPCKASQEKCGAGCCNANQACIGNQCLGACQFAIDNDLKTMTLQADCATTETILIADTFTLEGGNKTIHMAGAVAGY